MIARSKALLLLLIIVVMGACSSTYDDPELIFKEEIDSDFMTSLSRGESAVTFEVKECRKYSKESYADKWSDISTSSYNNNIMPQKLTIFQGRTWCSLNLPAPDTDNILNIISFVWTRYCYNNKFYKDFYIANKVGYNDRDQTIQLNDNTLNIEKANGNSLTLSHVGEQFTNTVSSIKTVFILEKTDFQQPDLDNILYFENQKEALLKMLELMRAYYGDVFQGSQFNEPYINLAGIENTIRKYPDLNDEDFVKLVWWE